MSQAIEKRSDAIERLAAFSLSSATRTALLRSTAVWAPPPRLKPSEWMEQNIILPASESSKPGRYRFTRHPFLREIADSFVDPTLWGAYIVKPSQVGWTTLFTGVIGYFMDGDPSRILVVQPTQEEAEIWSKDRFDEVCQASPAMRDKISRRKSRDAQNTIRHKKFRGGAIKMVGANSPTGLASWPAKIILPDEVDRYPGSAGDEGDPINIVRARAKTWLRAGGKFVAGSTPDIEGASRICSLYEEGDQRVYLVPCHDCGHAQELEFFKHVHWQKGPGGEHLTETAALVCENCGSAWSDRDRLRNIARGRWHKQMPGRKFASFRIGGLLSPDVTHVELAEKWLEAKKNEHTRKVFFNTDLGIPYKMSGEAPEAERLYERRETYKRGIVPTRALMLTAGVDVQRDRLECEVVGWGRDLESWSVDYAVLAGDPAHEAVWDKLDELLSSAWRRESGGEARIACTCVDTGFETVSVHNWWKRRRDSRVILIKGQDSLHSPIGAPQWIEYTRAGKRIKRGVQVWPVGVSYLKSELYANLRRDMPEDDQPAPGYCHFPQYGRDHFDGLTSEELISTKNRAGFLRRQWHKKQARNEQLDCRVYARAAAAVLQLERWPESKWEDLERTLGLRETYAEPEPVAAPVQRPVAQPAPSSSAGSGWRVTRSSFLGR